MKKAYILLAHKSPEQLLRLVNALDDGCSSFFIHLDRACNHADFQRELKQFSNCYFLKPEDGGWGKFGIVKATLHGLRSVRETGCSFDVISLLSGQDYPLRSNTYIDRFFEINRGKIFIEFFPLPTKLWYHNGLDRIFSYHLGNRKGRASQRLSHWVTRACNASFVLKRRFPHGLKPYGGWQWWSMPPVAVDEILSFLKRRPDYERYHRYSLLPDEMFFQTILLNSQSGDIRANLVNNCLRFVDWDNGGDLPAPVILTKDYLQPLIASKSLFARKFDVSRDAKILDALDARRADEEFRVMQGTMSPALGDFSRGNDFPNSPASPKTKIGLFSQS